MQCTGAKEPLGVLALKQSHRIGAQKTKFVSVSKQVPQVFQLKSCLWKAGVPECHNHLSIHSNWPSSEHWFCEDAIHDLEELGAIRFSIDKEVGEKLLRVNNDVIWHAVYFGKTSSQVFLSFSVSLMCRDNKDGVPLVEALEDKLTDMTSHCHSVRIKMDSVGRG